jgi:hypothetical protein
LRLRAGGLGIWVVIGERFDASTTRSEQIELALPSADGSELARAACALGRRLHRAGERLRKAGVLCTALTPADAPVQQALFTTTDDARRQRLHHAIDRINAQGVAIGTAAELGAPGATAAWLPHQTQRSGDHTTAWLGLRVVG